MEQLSENILLLIEKYHAGTATPEDKLRLNEWYQSFDDSEAVLERGENDSEQQLGDRIKKRLLETIDQDYDLLAIKPRRKWKIPAIAAVVLVLLSAGIYVMLSPGPSGREMVKTAPQDARIEKDIAPGGNRAVLILADGSTVVLDSIANGVISRQGNSKVQKLENGLVAYTIDDKQVTESGEALYNTISTPRGGQYKVTLSDGTKVWLNAKSSIRFPVVFAGPERNIEITGEAYFEVAPLMLKGGQKMPFKVKANSSEIVVLGTHFNVNAYQDEPSIKTTLLEGRIKISVPGSGDNQQATYLRPGQQAEIYKEGKIDVADHVDTEAAVAWMNGFFKFKSADLKTVLRQISRWYNVDVEYHGNVNLHFTGQLTKNENVSKVFEKLALTGEVRFKIDGRKIIVSR